MVAIVVVVIAVLELRANWSDPGKRWDGPQPLRNEHWTDADRAAQQFVSCDASLSTYEEEYVGIWVYLCMSCEGSSGSQERSGLAAAFHNSFAEFPTVRNIPQRIQLPPLVTISLEGFQLSCPDLHCGPAVSLVVAYENTAPRRSLSQTPPQTHVRTCIAAKNLEEMVHQVSINAECQYTSPASLWTKSSRPQQRTRIENTHVSRCGSYLGVLVRKYENTSAGMIGQVNSIAIVITSTVNVQ